MAERKKFSEMNKQEKIIFVVVIMVFFFGCVILSTIVGMKHSNNSGTGSNTSTGGAAALDCTGTATSEAAVGDDVEWTATVKNTGSDDISNLEANTDFGGLQLVSIDPTPTSQPISMVQDFGSLGAGQSITITYHLLASKVEVAKGSISFNNSDSGLSPQTVIR